MKAVTQALKRLSAAAAVLLAVAAAAVAAAEPATLKVWTMGEEGKKLEGLIALFEAENPGVRVVNQAIPWSAAHEKLITSIVGGITPDISQLGTTWMPEFHAMDALLPLDPYLAADPAFGEKDFFPAAWKTVKFQDGVYGLPWYVETRCLFYRKDALAQVGVAEPPRNWEELRAVGKKLSERSHAFGINLPWKEGGTLCMFIWQAGGRIFDEQGNIAVTEPACREALEFYCGLFRDKIAPMGEAGDLDPVTGFSDQAATIPLFISGPWSIHQIEQRNADQMKAGQPSIEGKWDIVPLPAGKRSASFLGGCNLVVFRGSRHPDLAWKFLRFCEEKKTQVEWFKLSDCLPSRMDAWQDPVLAGNRHLAPFEKQLHTAQPTPQIPEWEQVVDVMGRQMEKAIFNEQSVPEALTGLEAMIGQILKERAATQSFSYKLLVLGGTALFFLLLVILYFARSSGVKQENFGGGLDVREHGGAAKWVFLFLGPAVGLLIVFFFLPVLAAFLMSLTNYDIYSFADISRASVIGFQNYGTILQDEVFWKSVWNTLIFAAVGGPLTIVTALSAALALERITRCQAFFRSGLFLPVVTSLVAVAVVWKWIYHPRFGILNSALGFFGASPRDWLSNPDTALGCLIAMAVWKNFGYQMVIFLAGLQAIPKVYYEAAQIDGAGAIERFTAITLPLLAPTFILITITTTIGYMQFFAEPYIMTEGGPLDSTLSVVLYLYRKGFKFYRMGEAAAVSYILFFLIFVFSIGQVLWANRREQK